MRAMRPGSGTAPSNRNSPQIPHIEGESIRDARIRYRAGATVSSDTTRRTPDGFVMRF